MPHATQEAAFRDVAHSLSLGSLVLGAFTMETIPRWSLRPHSHGARVGKCILAHRVAVQALIAYFGLPHSPKGFSAEGWVTSGDRTAVSLPAQRETHTLPTPP